MECAAMPKLRHIRVEEVSLVRRAANRRKFLLLKEDTVEELIALLKLALENEDQIDQELAKAKLSAKAINAVKGALRLLSAYKDELPTNILNTLAKLGGYGSVEPEKTEKGDKDQKDQKGDDKPGDVKKMDDLPPWAKEKIDALQKSVDETSTALIKEIAERKAREFLIKAQSYDRIPGKPEELAQLLLKADGAGNGFGDALAKLLGAINTSMAQMYEQIGSDASAPDGGVMGEVTKRAKALLEKSDEVKTLEQAIVKVLERDPQLYDRYLEENKTK